MMWSPFWFQSSTLSLLSLDLNYGSDDGDGHDENGDYDDDENYENLSGLEWFALQRTLMLNSTGFHTGFKLFLWTWNIVSCQSEILYHSQAHIGVQNICTMCICFLFSSKKFHFPAAVCQSSRINQENQNRSPPSRLRILTSRENPISFCQHTPQRITLFVHQRLTRTTIKYNYVFGDTFSDCGFCSNRILLYFPMLVSVLVC